MYVQVMNGRTKKVAELYRLMGSQSSPLFVIDRYCKDIIDTSNMFIIDTR